MIQKSPRNPPKIHPKSSKNRWKIEKNRTQMPWWLKTRQKCAQDAPRGEKMRNMSPKPSQEEQFQNARRPTRSPTWLLLRVKKSYYHKLRSYSTTRGEDHRVLKPLRRYRRILVESGFGGRGGFKRRSTTGHTWSVFPELVLERFVPEFVLERFVPESFWAFKIHQRASQNPQKFKFGSQKWL